MGPGQEGTHSEHVIRWTGVDRDAAVQEQETADQRKSGGGRALLQTIKLMEVPGNRAAVHLQQVNRETTRYHGDRRVRGGWSFKSDTASP